MLDDLSFEEKELLNHLGQAWVMFAKLPPRHQWERWEFMQQIHSLQNMVMSRPILEEVYNYEEEDAKQDLIARL